MKFIIYDKSREEYQVPWIGKTLVIGRRVDADIRVDEPTMSAVHAKIFAASDGPRIRDLESLNGTYVNSKRTTEASLQPGDKIRIGRVMIVVSGPARAAATAAIDRISHPGEQEMITTQTVKIHLEELGSAQLQEDDHILLLRNLFEALESAADRRDALHKVRAVLKKAFRRARIFILRPADADDWQDPEAGDRPSAEPDLRRRGGAHRERHLVVLAARRSALLGLRERPHLRHRDRHRRPGEL